MYQTSLCYASFICLLLSQLVTTEKIKPASEQLDKIPVQRLDEVYDNYRLSTAVIPENYKLEVTTYLDDRDEFTFKGNVLITVSL